ncbi:MAG: FGGY family carbohydrate kinase [Oscillospiraceae bacterium]|nr:FGGY family carbohydrate kinase [Oscillospiraceae bacterium]
MDQNFVIAYDLGTSGVKVALVSMQGEVFGTAAASYPLYVEHEGWAEQDPALYWQGVCQATRQVIARCAVDPARAAGLAFSTQWKGIIPVDRDGRVLHNSIIWLDCRAGDQAERLNAQFGENLFCAADYWPKLMWFRENCPEIYDQAALIFEANSFLKWKATGEAAMDLSNCFVRSFDPVLQKRYAEILSFSGLELRKFPKWVNSSELVGHVTPTAAAEMGLVPGIPVFGGCGDIPANAIGSGSARLGGAHIYFGTSGWVAYSVPHSAKELYVSPFDATRDLALSAMNAIGLSFNWAVSRFYMAESAELGDGVFDLVNRELEQIPAGSEGLIALPWFYGERPPMGPEARGTFWNLGAQHDRRHMTRAVMEGISYTLRMCSRQYERQKGYDSPKELSAIGGGSLSPVWMQMLADIMEVPVNVPRDTKHTGAIGTAYCVLVGLGVCRDLGEADGKIVVAHRYEPKPENVQAYTDAFAKFERLYSAVEPLFNNK